MPTAGYKNVFYFNNENLKNFGQPLPHEFLEKKQWTWDTFEKVCKAVTTVSSNPEDNTYALGINTAYDFIYAAIASNGANYVKIDQDGRYVENLTDPRIIQALEWTARLNTQGYFEYTNDWWQKAQDGMIAGRYTFLPEFVWLGLIRNEQFLTVKMEKEFGWSPFPVGPEGTFGDWGSSINGENYYMAFPSTIDTERVIPVVNYMFEPFTGETTETWKDNLLRMSFFEEKSLNYYIEMLKSAEFDYTPILGVDMAILFGQVFKGSKTALETMESNRLKVQESLDKWNNMN
jgi:ABC-type glycerol-3-phosphate transport system substrate-binding protein